MDEIEYDKKFTEIYINLFVSFFNQCQIGDPSALKKIIRPNNVENL